MLLGSQEAFANGMVEQPGKRVEVAQDIQAADGFAVDAELGPGQDFAKLFVGAQSARQRDEGVGELCHEGFAVVHGSDDAQIGAAVRQLAIDEHLRDDADDLAARGKSRVGQHAHQADVAAAIDQSDAPLAEEPAKCCCHFGILGAVTR